MKTGILKDIARSMKLAWSISKFSIIAPIILAAVSAAVYFIPVHLSAYVLDSLEIHRSIGEIMTAVLISLGMVLALGIFSSYLGERNQLNIHSSVMKFSSRISDKAISMDYPQSESPRVNEIRRKAETDNQWGNGIVGIFNRYAQILRHVVMIITSVVVLVPMMRTNALSIPVVIIFIAAIAMLSIIPSVYYSQVTNKKYFNLMEEYSTRKSPFLHFAYGKGIGYKEGKDIRIFHAEKLINKSIEQEEKNFIHGWTKRIARSESLGGLVLSGCNSGVMIISYIFVMLQAMQGAISVGSVVKYATTMLLFARSMTDLSDTISFFVNTAKQQISRTEFLEIPDVLPKGNAHISGDAYEIEFKDVSFKYPGNDFYSLKNISIKLNCGERLAVVGMNGSGKTTFIKLLSRLYDPTEGIITLNGRDIREYDYSEYMQLLSVVFQDFKLFSFGIGENVAAGYEYDKARAAECLRKAGFKSRLDTLDRGLDTCLYKDFEENGVEISGGEAQKIAIARAIYKNAPFIVLDEPTAALDPMAEYEIYSKFDELAENKTTIYISHRLSSCRFCDRIVVFDKGETVQYGSHDELVAQDGKYAELWNAQAQYYR